MQAALTSIVAPRVAKLRSDAANRLTQAVVFLLESVEGAWELSRCKLQERPDVDYAVGDHIVSSASYRHAVDCKWPTNDFIDIGTVNLAVFEKNFAGLPLYWVRDFRTFSNFLVYFL